MRLVMLLHCSARPVAIFDAEDDVSAAPISYCQLKIDRHFTELLKPSDVISADQIIISIYADKQLYIASCVE